MQYQPHIIGPQPDGPQTAPIRHRRLLKLLTAALAALIVFEFAALAVVLSGDRNAPTPGAADTAVTGATPTPTETAVPDPSEITRTFGSNWCAQGCRTLAELDELIPNGVIRGAMTIAYHHHPELRPFIREAVARRTRVIVATPARDGLASYSPSMDTIRISPAFLDEPSSVTASVLAHEVIHAADGHGSDDPATCFEEEMRAVAWQAQTWNRVNTGTAFTPYTNAHHQIEAAWQADQLLDWVLRNPVYQEQCLGRELRGP